MTRNKRDDDEADVGLDVHVTERYFTRPAIDRRLPEQSREPRTALALLESEVILDGDPSKNLATFVTTFNGARSDRRHHLPGSNGNRNVR